MTEPIVRLLLARETGSIARPRGSPPLAAVIVVLVAAALAVAAERGLSGHEGHPRERFPLTLHLPATGNPALDTAARRAVSDWNTLGEATMGLSVFAEASTPESAQVVVVFERSGSHLMGEARVDAGTDGVIVLPVRVVVFEPAARGQTPREVVFYQVLAHELGHALGLAHGRDPRSLMCCVAGSVDFDDPAQRQAYIDARRQPDLATVRGQLTEHYGRFWGARRP